MRYILTTMVFMTSVLMNINANATLIGATVDCDRIFEGTDHCDNPTTVGPGIEWIDASFNIDVSDSTIRMDRFGPGGFTFASPTDNIQQFYEFTGLVWQGNPTAEIIGLDLSFQQTGGEIDGGVPISASNFSFTASSVKFLVGGLRFEIGDFVEIGLITSHGNVSAPTTLALLGLGLAGLGISRRKKA